MCDLEGIKADNCVRQAGCVGSSLEVDCENPFVTLSLLSVMDVQFVYELHS